MDGAALLSNNGGKMGAVAGQSAKISGYHAAQPGLVSHMAVRTAFFGSQTRRYLAPGGEGKQGWVEV